jgi:quercetin dioxygenase-like cupin family protein/ketosteroid isomerase-like protein
MAEGFKGTTMKIYASMACVVLVLWEALATVAVAADATGREVLLDNPHVQVVRLEYPAGGESGLHTHEYPARTVYVLQGGEVEIVTPTGEKRPLTLATGSVFVMPAATHNIHNVGTSAVILLEQELKYAQPVVDEALAKTQIRALLTQFLKGVDEAEVHNHFWAEDLVYTSSRGTRTNKAAIMAGFESPSDTSAEGPVYSAEDVDIRLYGETAVLAFTLVAKASGEAGQAATTDYYLNTGTLLKREGAWQVVAWQATKKAAP